MSNWNLKKDEEEEINISEIINTVKYILIKLTVKDFVIILLILMMFLIYIMSQADISQCNIYYQNLLKNITRLTTSLW